MWPRIRLFWYEHSQVIKWASVALIALAAIIGAFLFVTRGRYEIAPQLRIYCDINDAVVMNVRTISDGVVEISVTNESSAYLLFGYTDFYIEYFCSPHWRVLPVRRDVAFVSAGLVLSPDSSLVYNMDFAWLYHCPRNGELYKIRLETSVAYGEEGLPPGIPVAMHDIAVEFVYGATQP